MENHYAMTLEFFRQLSPEEGLLRDLMHTIGRLGVPIFISLSGYLLIVRHPCRKVQDFISFYKKKWWPLLRCWWLWISIYAIYAYLNWGYSNLKELANTFIFQAQSYQMWHAWYMPMIIGIYLVIPFYSAIYHNLDKGIFYLLLGFCVLKSVILPLAHYHGFWDLSGFGDCYSAYILLGVFAITVTNAEKIGPLLVKAAPILSIAAIIYIGFYFFGKHSRNIDVNIWYDNPRLLIASFLIFISFYNLRNLNFWPVSWLSKRAFALYLIHFPIIYALSDYAPIKASFTRPVSSVITWSITVLTGCLIIALLAPIPLVRKYLFLMK